MVTETDDRGRLYLPKGLRDRHGERFRVVDLPSRVVLIPVDDDPLGAVRDAVGGQLAGRSVAELERETRTAVREAVDAEAEERERRRNESEDASTTE
jgi:bifunctional DNA-binding transcriptional regulator/antitoxin component of YhaV-PrlF toxin-antitoxin module